MSVRLEKEGFREEGVRCKAESVECLQPAMISITALLVRASDKLDIRVIGGKGNSRSLR